MQCPVGVEMLIAATAIHTAAGLHWAPESPISSGLLLLHARGILMLLFCAYMLGLGASGWVMVITVEGLLFGSPKLALLLLHWALLLYACLCTYVGFVVILDALDTALHCCKLGSWSGPLEVHCRCPERSYLSKLDQTTILHHQDRMYPAPVASLFAILRPQLGRHDAMYLRTAPIRSSWKQPSMPKSANTYKVMIEGVFGLTKAFEGPYKQFNLRRGSRSYNRSKDS